jgi:hypothetical protein
MREINNIQRKLENKPTGKTNQNPQKDSDIGATGSSKGRIAGQV